MALKTFIWFQGESNLGQGAKYYGCAQSAMITMWREYFKVPSAFFGFVEVWAPEFVCKGSKRFPTPGKQKSGRGKGGQKMRLEAMPSSQPARGVWSWRGYCAPTFFKR